MLLVPQRSVISISIDIMCSLTDGHDGKHFGTGRVAGLRVSNREPPAGIYKKVDGEEF